MLDLFNRRELRRLRVELEVTGAALGEQLAARLYLERQRDALLRALRPAYREWLLRTYTYDDLHSTRAAGLTARHRVDLENAFGHLRALGLLDDVDPRGDER